LSLNKLILDYRRTKWLPERVIKYTKVYLVNAIITMLILMYNCTLSKSVEARRHNNI